MSEYDLDAFTFAKRALEAYGDCNTSWNRGKMWQDLLGVRIRRDREKASQSIEDQDNSRGCLSISLQERCPTHDTQNGLKLNSPSVAHYHLQKLLEGSM